MTTLISIKGKGFVIVGADTQVTEGHLKVPFPYPKISLIGNNILVGGCGSVGNLQRVLQIATRNIRINKAADDLINVSPSYHDLVKMLANLNFQMPLEHKHYNSYAFLVAGLDQDKEPAVSSVGSCGAVLNIPTFYSDGSGSPYAYATLESGYKETLTEQEALNLGLKALTSATSLDCYTNNTVQLFSLKVNNEDGKWEVHEYQTAEEINQLGKPKKAEATTE